jgi:hypothetical protein
MMTTTDLINELRWLMYMATLELPYVKGAAPGEDPARDDELRAVANSLDAHCILDDI